MKKILIALGAVIVIVVAGRAFWAYRQMNTQTVVPSVVADDTAGWKTYTNDKYGFSFKYPPTWILSEDVKNDFPAIVSEPSTGGSKGRYFSVYAGEDQITQKHVRQTILDVAKEKSYPTFSAALLNKNYAYLQFVTVIKGRTGQALVSHFIEEEPTFVSGLTTIDLPDYGLSLVASTPSKDDGTAVFSAESANILNSFELTR